MSPLIGIYASEMSANLFEPAGSYDALATVTLSATTASVSFAGIPSGYKHLQIRWIGRSTRNLFVDGNIVRFNGDSGANYAKHNLYGTGGGSVGSEASTSQTGINLGDTIGGTATAGNFTPGIIDILDYSSSTKNKTLRALQGYYFDSSTSVVAFKSGLWMNTTPITSISFTPEIASFAVNTQFALYGVK